MVRMVALLVLAVSIVGQPITAQERAPFPGRLAPVIVGSLADGSAINMPALERVASIVVLHFWGVT